MAVTPHHIGICVTDLEKSLRFWCDGLGFETTMVPPVGSEWKEALEVRGEGDLAFTAHFIKKDGFEFELLHYANPGVHGQASTSRNQLGFTHLALYVDDLDATHRPTGGVRRHPCRVDPHEVRRGPDVHGARLRRRSRRRARRAHEGRGLSRPPSGAISSDPGEVHERPIT